MTSQTTSTLDEQQRERFLSEPRVGVVSVASDDGRPPLTVPVWYAFEPGGNLTFFTNTQGRTTRKTGLIRRAGVLSFCVQKEEPPYRYVTIEGTVVADDQPPSVEQVLAVARRYMPEEMAQAFVAAELGRDDCRLVVFTVRPDRWLGADFSDD